VDLGLPKSFTKQSEVVATFSLPATAATFGITISDGVAPSGPKVETMMAKTDMPGGDYNITHHPANTDPKVCQALCEADAKCKSWTYVVRGSPAGSGDCCLKSVVPCPQANKAGMTSGAKTEQTLPGCGDRDSTIQCTVEYTPPLADLGGNTYYEVPVQCGSTKDTLRLLPSEKEVELRIFTDWTFMEAYFQKGRIAMTVVSAINDNTGISVTSTADVTASAVTAYPIKSIWVSADDVRNAPRVYTGPSGGEESVIV